MSDPGRPDLGCELCRELRVTCDEAKPSCGPCLEAGTLCPGWREASFPRDVYYIGHVPRNIINLQVTNLHCQSCVFQIKKVLRRVDRQTGVMAHSFSPPVISVAYPQGANVGSIIIALEEAGFELQEPRRGYFPYEWHNTAFRQADILRRWGEFGNFGSRRRHQEYCEACKLHTGLFIRSRGSISTTDIGTPPGFVSQFIASDPPEALRETYDTEHSAPSCKKSISSATGRLTQPKDYPVETLSEEEVFLKPSAPAPSLTVTQPCQVPNTAGVSQSSRTSLTLADLRGSRRDHSPSPEYSRPLKKLENRARDRMSQDIIGDNSRSISPAGILISGASSNVKGFGSTKKAPRHARESMRREVSGRPAPIKNMTRNITRNAKHMGASWPFALTLLDYTAEYTEELSIRKGDLILIITADGPRGWWYGSLRGRHGWFPSNYCRRTALVPSEDTMQNHLAYHEDNHGFAKSQSSLPETSEAESAAIAQRVAAGYKKHSHGQQSTEELAPRALHGLDDDVYRDKHYKQDTFNQVTARDAKDISMNYDYEHQSIAEPWKRLLPQALEQGAKEGRAVDTYLTHTSSSLPDLAVQPQRSLISTHACLERIWEAFRAEEICNYSAAAAIYRDVSSILRYLYSRQLSTGLIIDVISACSKRVSQLDQQSQHSYGMLEIPILTDDFYELVRRAQRSKEGRIIHEVQSSQEPDDELSTATSLGSHQGPATMVEHKDLQPKEMPEAGQDRFERGLDDEVEDFSDTASLASIFSRHSLGSSHTSASSVAHIELFDACIEAFAKHERFAHLCRVASNELDVQQFERNLRRLLAFHADQLRHHVSDALESQVVGYFLARVRLAAERLTALFFLPKQQSDVVNNDDRYLPAKGTNYSDRKESDDKYEKDNNAEIVIDVADEPGLENDVDESAEQHPEDDNDDVRYLPFEQVRNFVMSEDVFTTVLDKLETFVSRARAKQYAKLGSCAYCDTSTVDCQANLLHYCSGERQWLCTFSTCRNDEVFANAELLKAHQMGVHNIGEHVYTCSSPACAPAQISEPSISAKVWPRLDNFKLHCLQAHPDENVEDLIVASRRSAWDQSIVTKSSVVTAKPLAIPRKKLVRPHGWLTLAMSHARNFLEDATALPPEIGKERVYFHCGCGRRVADDYTELEPGGLDTLRRTLNRMERRSPSSISQTPTKMQDTENMSPAPFQQNQVTVLFQNIISFVYNPGSTSATTLPQHIPQSHVAQTYSGPPRRPGSFNNHLVLVLPHMKRASRVHQPSSDWILSDHSFFTSLSEQYKTARGAFRSAVSWKSLTDMRFVKFDMLRSGLAQVQKLDDIPPRSTEDYEYEPVEWTPPIGPELMLHLMEHPDQAEPDQVLFKWVPKKLRQKLEACPVRGHCDGWGIQYIEDVDRERVSVVLFACAVASIVLALTWTICKRDVQGGFTIAGTMFVILSTGVGAAETLFGGSAAGKVGG